MKDFLAILVVTALLVCVAPLLFMFCFNYTAPLFWAAAPSLNFLQALAIVVGVRVLVGQNPLGVGVDKENE